MRGKLTQRLRWCWLEQWTDWKRRRSGGFFRSWFGAVPNDSRRRLTGNAMNRFNDEMFEGLLLSTNNWHMSLFNWIERAVELVAADEWVVKLNQVESMTSLLRWIPDIGIVNGERRRRRRRKRKKWRRRTRQSQTSGKRYQHMFQYVNNWCNKWRN